MDSETSRDRCRYFAALFSPYIEGQLSELERKALAEHLHECEECAEQFGASWREAAAKISSGKRRTRNRAADKRSALWLLMIGSFVGVLALGAMGILDAGEAADPLQVGRRKLIGEELSHMVAVQTELLKAVVGPLRGSDEQVSHAVRGEALDFFEALAKQAAVKLEPKTEPEWAASFHELFRASDPATGGRDWDRREFLAELAENGLPAPVLVRVHSGFKEVILCSVAWGKRPALAWLLRRRAQPEGDKETRPFQLAFLLFSKP